MAWESGDNGGIVWEAGRGERGKEGYRRSYSKNGRLEKRGSAKSEGIWRCKRITKV